LTSVSSFWILDFEFWIVDLQVSPGAGLKSKIKNANPKIAKHLAPLQGKPGAVGN
jgi:hypothetical protein